MIVHIIPTDLLLVQNWQVVHLFEDPSRNNIHKFWIAPLPVFNEVAFPFLVVSGSKTFNLINVKDRRMEVLLEQAGHYIQA